MVRQKVLLYGHIVDECTVFSGEKPVRNMTALVSSLVDSMGKAMLRDQGAEFLNIRVGLYIKVEVEIPDDDSLVPLCKSFV